METRSKCGSVWLVGAGAWLAAALAAPTGGQATTRVSVDSSGTQGNDESDISSISADGRYVAFHSLASNLVGGDTNGFEDVFVRDRQSGTTERVSVDSGGAQGNSYSFVPLISADGRYVAFDSAASNLVGGDTNGFPDVFVRDRQSGTTERVSVDSGGAQGNFFSRYPSISADGRYVAFQSGASNLVGGDTNGFEDVFVRDRQSGTTERVSVDSGGAQGNLFSRYPSISADGRYVAFQSYASNLVIGDTNQALDIFIRDRQSGTTERVSVNSGGAQGNSDSTPGRGISAGGRYVTFKSGATNLVSGDTNGASDVFIRDRQSGTTERVSVNSGGAQGNSDSYDSSISADGRYVTFHSRATNLVSGDTNVSHDIFVRDRQSGTTERISVDSGGAQGNSDSYYPSISADGRCVAFQSYATNLVSGDTNFAGDVFVRAQNTALVIGNSNYAGCAGDLPGVAIDATNVSAMLETAGWRVVLIRDQTAAQIQTAITNNIPPAIDPYLIYYAGHGDNSVAGQGSLVGVDCNNVTPAAFQTALGAASNRTVVILDSCGSGGFAQLAQDANNLPAFLTSTNNVLSACTRSCAGGHFTNAVRPCALTGGPRTLQQVSNCLSQAGGYDPTYQQHFYNGTLPNTVIGDSAGVRGCLPGAGGVIACPCTNPPTESGRGCNNSSNTGGAHIMAVGRPSLVADTLVLSTLDERPTATSIVLQGTTLVATGAVYGQGVRCVGGTLERLYVKNAVCGSITVPGGSDVAVHTRSAQLGTIISAGATLHYMVYYRDSIVLGGCPANSTFTGTPSLAVSWTP